MKSAQHTKKIMSVHKGYKKKMGSKGICGYNCWFWQRSSTWSAGITTCKLSSAELINRDMSGHARQR